MAGTFGATPARKRGERVLRWVLTGNTGGVLHVIEGAEQAPLNGTDPWASVTTTMLLRIAAVTAEGLSSRLAELGSQPVAEACRRHSTPLPRLVPARERDIYETYYRPLAAAAAAGGSVPPPAPTPPPAPGSPHPRRRCRHRSAAAGACRQRRGVARKFAPSPSPR